MDSKKIIALFFALVIASVFIELLINGWKHRGRQIIVDVVETGYQKHGSDGLMFLFIVTYKDGHTEEEWVAISHYKYETYHNWKELHSKSEQEYSFEHDMKMTIELRKIFNLFRPEILLILLAEILGAVAVGYPQGILIGIIVVTVTLIMCCLPHSKILNVEGQSVKYRVYRKRYKGMRRGAKGGYYREHEYIYRESVGKAETVEFCQNIIEKIFNVGHIKFIEDGTTNKHSVYGITNFNKRKREIERIFKTYYF